MNPDAPKNSPWKDAEPGEAEFLNAARQGLQCPHPDALFAARSGALGPEAERQVEQHIEQCHACTAFLSALEDPNLAELQPAEQTRIRNVVFAEVEKPRAEAPPRRSRLWFLIPAVAAAAAAVVLLAPSRRDPVPQAPPVAAKTKPVEPKQVLLAFSKPPVQLPANALLFRGADDPAASYAQELTNALAPYASNDYAGAAKSLEPVARKYPKNPEASFYLGVSLLFLDRPADAVSWLEMARATFQGDQSAEASWFLAVALQRAGNTVRALAELKALCDKPGTHQSEACEAAKQ